MALTQHQREIVLTELETGASLRKAAKAADLGSEKAIRVLVDQDAEFATQYTRARDIGMDRLADEVLEIADSATKDTYGESRLQVDARRWYVSKLAPKRYGDRLDLQHSGSISRTDALTDEELAAVVAAKAPPAP